MSKTEFASLVTDNPQGNYQWLHNMTVIKDREVYLRDFNGEGDLSLVDYCKRECKKRCNRVIDAPVEEFAEYMDCDCIVSYFHHMAIGHAELRERLKYYEAVAPEIYEALEKANVFITNGIELGYIRVPDLECGDAAIETPEIIRKALAKARGKKHE